MSGPRHGMPGGLLQNLLRSRIPVNVEEFETILRQIWIIKTNTLGLIYKQLPRRRHIPAMFPPENVVCDVRQLHIVNSTSEKVLDCI